MRESVEKINSSNASQASNKSMASIVIVNAYNCSSWINKLIYTLDRAGLKISEDYQHGNSDRIIIFKSENIIN